MIRQSLVAYGAPLQETQAALPAPQGTEVLLRVRHCGLCHSDLHLQDGHFDLGGGRTLDISAGRDLPFTLGHEITGRIEQAGPDAHGLDLGKLYAVYAWIGCGGCRKCAEGQEHLCDKPRQIGINCDGGFASHVLVPHPRYLIDATGIDPLMAGSAMCSGLTAYGAIAKAMPYLRGQPLVISGLGGVGMMALQIARAVAEAPVLGLDIAAEKRRAALDLGATAVFDPGDPDTRRTIFRMHGPAGAAIDLVGSDQSLNLAHSLIGKAGAVVVVGLMGGSFALPVPMFPLRELAILGSYVGSLQQARELMDLMRQGRIAPIPIAPRPLAEANAALDELRAGKIVGRAALTP